MTSFSPLYGLLLMTLPLSPLDSFDSDLGWHVVNDDVMGGRSEGSFEKQQGEVKFTGRTNTNGGGFSSIRTKPLQLDLSNRTGMQLTVKGDGRRYTWQLTSTARWRGRQISYWADFETASGEWRTVNIPFSSFIPRFRGNELDGPALDPRKIAGMGLMIYDKKDGPFELQLASVGTYSADTTLSLEQYQWKNRVLVLRAPSDNDENLRLQQTAVARSAEEFEDRDMVLVTLLGAEAFSVTLIGKDGSIKLSKETATSMGEIYALIDSMPMRRNEMSDRL